MTQHEILRHFKGVQGSGTKYMALCPAHDDHNPSLSIDFEDGRALMYCFAGCEYKDIIAAAGMKLESQPWVLECEYIYSVTLKKIRWRLPDGSKRFTWKHRKG
jgi:hypothetical protein